MPLHARWFSWASPFDVRHVTTWQMPAGMLTDRVCDHLLALGAAVQVGQRQVNYGGGDFYNGEPRHFSRRASPQELIRLYLDDGELVLDLPTANEAVVPQRPGPWPDLPLEPEHQASSGTAHGPSPDADAE